MINRLDNICEAVLKGKWPVNRRQMFDFQGLIPGYTPTAVDSPLQKRSFAELSMVGQASVSGSEDITASPQLSKARLHISLFYLKYFVLHALLVHSRKNKN